MHYICTAECKGFSEEPTKCGSKVCSMAGEPFVPCDCKDGKHYGRQDDKKEEEN